MYNGIGLSTVRGSGTNGYVTKNLSYVRPSKDKVNYKTEEDIKKAEAQISRGPNQGILDHERKRKLEVKCLELEDVLRDQGANDEEIAVKVQAYREMLLGKNLIKVIWENGIKNPCIGKYLYLVYFFLKVYLELRLIFLIFIFKF